MKRFLFVFSILVIITSLTAVAFANTMITSVRPNTKLSDIVGTKYEAAVNELVARGVINGYLDNTFKPTNDITRAEMAKMLVTAAKLNNEVESNKNKEIFSDVTSKHWAIGYINVAYKNDYIVGYGDGTFAPDDNVTYAEAITMVVRMLGYKSAVEAKGEWPDNYIKKAESLKLLSNVDFSTSKKNYNATRGDVANLIWNALKETKTYYKAGILEDVNTSGLGAGNGDAIVTIDGESYTFRAKDNKKISASNLEKYIDGVVFYKLNQEIDEGYVIFESGITVETILADNFDDYVEVAEGGKVLFENRGVESFKETFEKDFDDYIFVKFNFDTKDEEATNISLVANNDAVKASDFEEFDRIYMDESEKIVYIVSGLEEKIVRK